MYFSYKRSRELCSRFHDLILHDESFLPFSDLRTQLRLILYFVIVRALRAIRRTDCPDIAVKPGKRENANGAQTNKRTVQYAIPKRRLLNDSAHRADGWWMRTRPGFLHRPVTRKNGAALTRNPIKRIGVPYPYNFDRDGNKGSR